VRYVLSNEQRRWIKFVRVYGSPEEVPWDVPEPYRFLHSAYPELTVEYVAMVGVFGPSKPNPPPPCHTSKHQQPLPRFAIH